MPTTKTSTKSYSEIKKLILSQVPKMFKKDSEIKAYVLDLTSKRYVKKEDFDKKFDRILNELQKDREENWKKWLENQKKLEENDRKWHENQKKLEENDRKWHENQKKLEENDRKWHENQKKLEENDRKWHENQKKLEENDRKWHENQKRLDALHNELIKDREENKKRWEENDRRWLENQKKLEENDRKWHENQQTIKAILEEIKQLNRKHDTSIGALGARWGLIAESTFRDAIKGIVEEITPYKVQRYQTFDENGVVFGRPDQIELDILINDGQVILAEIKSSISKPDIAVFLKKVKLYEEKEQKRIDKKLIISPMVHHKALDFAKTNQIIVYGYPEDIDIKELQR